MQDKVHKVIAEAFSRNRRTSTVTKTFSKDATEDE